MASQEGREVVIKGWSLVEPLHSGDGSTKLPELFIFKDMKLGGVGKLGGTVGGQI